MKSDCIRVAVLSSSVVCKKCIIGRLQEDARTFARLEKRVCDGYCNKTRNGQDEVGKELALELISTLQTLW